MSAAVQPATKLFVEGSFETEALASGLLTPLQDLLKCDIQRLVVNFQSDKKVSINALNDNRTCSASVEYTDEITNLLNIKSDYSLGLYQLSEFVSLATIFNSGFGLTIENNLVTIENDGQLFSFVSSDADAIKQGPKKISTQLKWFTEFKWIPAEFDKFNKAMGRLNQDYVLITGKAGENFVNLKVCDKDIQSSSTFSQIVNVEDNLESDFKVVFPKKYISSVVNSSIKELLFQISDKLIEVRGKTDFHKVKYYILATEV